MRGYFGLCFYQPQHDSNVGSGFRSCYAMGGNFIATIGRKYKKQSTDTCDTCKHIPYYHYLSYEDFIVNKPEGCKIVCVEIAEHARELENFIHPERAVYIVGNENYGIHEKYLKDNLVVKIKSKICLNVSCAASIVLSHRVMQMEK